MFNLNFIIMSTYAYWLDNKIVADANKFQPAQCTNTQLVLCEAISQKLTKEADVMMPIGSTGFRCTDIDTINDASADPRVVNTLLGYLKPQMQDVDHSNLSDDFLAENVVPAHIDFSSVQNLMGSIDNLRLQMDNAKAEELAKAKALLDAAKTPPVVEPQPQPKTE